MTERGAAGGCQHAARHAAPPQNLLPGPAPQVYVTNGGLLNSLAISASLFLIVMSSVLIGTLLPFGLQRVGIDPANAGGWAGAAQVAWRHVWRPGGARCHANARKALLPVLVSSGGLVLCWQWHRCLSASAPPPPPLLGAGTSVQVVMDVSGEQNAGAAVLCCCGSRRMGHEGERRRGDALQSAFFCAVSWVTLLTRS